MEKEVIAQFNQGQDNAFKALYRQFYPYVFFYTQKWIKDTSQAEDITAEIFVKLWNSRGRFENEQNISAFLKVTARNACVDYFRSVKRDTQNLAAFSQLQEAVQGPDSIDEVKAEVIRLVQLEVDRMPRKLKKVFELAFFEGKTNEEIAALLNINNQSVRNYKVRAIKLIRQAFAGRKVFLLLFALLYLKK